MRPARVPDRVPCGTYRGAVRRRGAQAFLLVAAALVSVAVLAAILHTGSAPGPGREPDRAVLGAGTAARVDSCDDVLLVGVDGGGEVPADASTFGRTVGVFAQAFARLAASGDRSVQELRVDLATRPASDLIGARSGPDKARRAVNAKRARAWREPVTLGVERLTTAVDKASFACPEQQIVLVGHAQGAAVVHRALAVIQDRTEGLGRVVGAALISDPERRARSVAGQLVGAPAAGPARAGLFAKFLPPTHDVPPGTPTFAVWSICTAGDLVCDPSTNTVAEALRLAHGYRYGAGAAPVRAAAKGLWRMTTLWPLPQPEIQVLSLLRGQPARLQLAVSVDPAAAAGVAWGEPRQLPPGLTLDRAGLLTGTPTEAGTWNLTYVVSNTQPATTGVTGVVVVTVGAESATVTAGGQASCETHADGSAWCWGRNNFGQLGDGTTTARETPVEVVGAAEWDQLSISGSTTCGIRSEATLWCWGLNDFGQLGIGRGPAHRTPVQVGSADNWTSVSTSWFHTCGVRSNGSLWCWGQNDRGQVGAADLRVKGFPTRVGSDDDWASVTTGGWFTCATRDDATAWCWGQNIFGQLGNADLEPSPVPVQLEPGTTWAQLSAGWAHTCGITTEGEARCWGLNNRGQLGDGSRALRRTPEPVSGNRIWTNISSGDAHTCGVDNSGGAWCWGSNRYTQLGDTEGASSTVPVLVRSEHLLLSVDAGWFHACGSLDSGVTACWGNNELGQIGNGSRVDQPVPEEVR